MNNSPPLIFNENYIERVNTHKHLGLYLSSTLDWSKQLDEVCLRANRKLSVLRSVNILSRQTLDLLYKITIRSVIDYSLPVYFKSPLLGLIEIGGMSLQALYVSPFLS